MGLFRNKPLVKTMTGEHYQLARVHYKVHNRTKVVRAFRSLKCMDFEQPRQRWAWFYEREAADLGLQVAWDQVPRDHIPVVLGAFFFKSDQEGFFHFNSFERAAKGIAFFDKRLPRSVLEVTDIELCNKLFDAPVDHVTIHAEHFDCAPSPRSKAEVAEERIAMIESSSLSNEQKFRLLLEDTQRRAKKPLDLVERIPTNFYDDGIEFLETALRFREMIAIQHWLGKKDYSFWDMVQEVMKHNPGMLGDLRPT